MNCLRGSRYFILLMHALVVGRSDAEASDPSIPNGRTRVPIQKAWWGVAPIAARKEAPERGYVADTASWKKIWHAFNQQEPDVPDVDFEKSVVLVVASHAPNLHRVRVNRSKEGDIGTISEANLREYLSPKKFDYVFMLIKREGIKTIYGKQIVTSDSQNAGEAEQK